MLQAEVIDPSKRKSKLCCSRCSLSYSPRDYKILYENEKLAFFKLNLPPESKKLYCHDCVYKSISEFMGEKPGKLKLLMKSLEGQEVVITFQKE